MAISTAYWPTKEIIAAMNAHIARMEEDPVYAKECREDAERREAAYQKHKKKLDALVATKR